MSLENSSGYQVNNIEDIWKKIDSNLSHLGPPGAGKSTSAQLLARSEGYVYYEADCFGMFVNPFVDPNVEEPTLAMGSQRPLKVITILKVDAFQFTSTNKSYLGSFKKSS